MPFDAGSDLASWTFETADRWRAANSPEGVGHKSMGFRDDAITPAGAGVMSAPLVGEVKAVLDKGPPVAAAGGVDGDGIEALAARAQAAEVNAYHALAAAYAQARMEIVDGGDLGAVATARMNAASSLPGLQRTYVQAANARLDVERRVMEELERRGILIEVDEAWKMVSEAMRPVVDGLGQLPKLVAVRANRENPGQAEAAITEGVNVIIAAARRAVERGEQ